MGVAAVAAPNRPGPTGDSMCEKCVAAGSMTEAEADAQKAAIDGGNFGDFLKPILASIQREQAKDAGARYIDQVNDTMDMVTELGSRWLEMHDDLPDHEVARELAAANMFRLSHRELAILVADVAIRLARIDNPDGVDDDLDDADDVDVAAVRLADEADEAEEQARVLFGNLIDANSGPGAVPAPGQYL